MFLWGMVPLTINILSPPPTTTTTTTTSTKEQYLAPLGYDNNVSHYSGSSSQCEHVLYSIVVCGHIPDVLVYIAPPIKFGCWAGQPHLMHGVGGCVTTPRSEEVVRVWKMGS